MPTPLERHRANRAWHLAVMRFGRVDARRVDRLVDLVRAGEFAQMKLVNWIS